MFSSWQKSPVAGWPSLGTSGVLASALPPCGGGKPPSSQGFSHTHPPNLALTLKGEAVP